MDNPDDALRISTSSVKKSDDKLFEVSTMWRAVKNIYNDGAGLHVPNKYVGHSTSNRKFDPQPKAPVIPTSHEPISDNILPEDTGSSSESAIPADIGQIT